MAINHIDYTFIAYQNALTDWMNNPDSIEIGTHEGFFKYFPLRQFVEFDLQQFPELYMIYTERLRTENPTQLLWNNGFRTESLVIASMDRAHKHHWPRLKNHFTSIRIRTLEELKKVLSTESLIYVSKWHRITPVGYFIGNNWPDATLQSYITDGYFWMVHEKDDRVAEVELISVVAKDIKDYSFQMKRKKEFTNPSLGTTFKMKNVSEKDNKCIVCDTELTMGYCDLCDDPTFYDNNYE